MVAGNAVVSREELAFLFAADGDEDLSILVLSELDTGDTDTTSGRVDEDGLGSGQLDCYLSKGRYA